MKVVFDPEQKRHYPRHFLVNGVVETNPEVPERADRLLAAARQAGLEHVVPADHGLAPISAVHTPEYIAFLSTIHERWLRIEGGSDEVVPGIHPDRRDGAYPLSAVAQAGYHMADGACPVAAGSWAAIKRSADAAAEAALMVREGTAWAYALSRPPGHHAFADMAGGFCYVNNSGVAAQMLLGRHERVAILDVDVHHGNGTQGMFYKRPDILTVSIHADPVRFYPFFWGHADERGAGAGLGYNYNLPLPRGTDDEAYMPALAAARRRIEAFAPGALVVALGLDAYKDDPQGGFAITTDGFGRIGEMIGRFGLPTVLVQEGGYLCDGLGANLTHFLQGFGASHTL